MGGWVLGTGSLLTDSKYRRKMELGRVDGKGLGGEAKWPTTSFLIVCLELFLCDVNVYIHMLVTAVAFWRKNLWFVELVVPMLSFGHD